MWIWNSAKILEQTVPTHACEAQGNGRAQGRTVSGNSSVADCSRRLSSRSPKNTGSGFVSSASLTLEGSMGSASKRRPGLVDVPGTGSASPTGASSGEEGDGFVVFVGAFAIVGPSEPHFEGSADTSEERAAAAPPSLFAASHRLTTASADWASKPLRSSVSASTISSELSGASICSFMARPRPDLAAR